MGVGPKTVGQRSTTRFSGTRWIRQTTFSTADRKHKTRALTTPPCFYTLAGKKTQGDRDQEAGWLPWHGVQDETPRRVTDTKDDSTRSCRRRTAGGASTMSDNSYERWAELADREAAGETLTQEELEFCRRFERENPTADAEIEFLRQLGG